MNTPRLRVWDSWEGHIAALLVPIVLSAGCLPREELDTGNLLVQLLAGQHEPALTLGEDKDYFLVQYAPDNTGIVLKMPRTHPRRQLDEFAFVYLFYAGSYTYLQDFVTRTGKRHAQGLIRANRGPCRDADELALASCVLRALAKTCDVRGEFRRFDEGVESRVIIHLYAELSVEDLRRTRRWQEAHWTTR
jgi:hypothetical protein